MFLDSFSIWYFWIILPVLSKTFYKFAPILLIIKMTVNRLTELFAEDLNFLFFCFLIPLNVLKLRCWKIAEKSLKSFNSCNFFSISYFYELLIGSVQINALEAYLSHVSIHFLVRIISLDFKLSMLRTLSADVLT